MFIKKLYQYNKTAAIALVLSLAAYLFINYKWGITATPFLQYGMYSSPVHIKDTQAAYIVVANNDTINSAAISLTNRDFLQVYLANYEKYKAVNENAFNTMNKYLLGLAKENHFVYNTTDSIFTKWFTAKLSAIIEKPVQTLQVYKQNYLWNGNALVPIDSPFKPASIVP